MKKALLVLSLLAVLCVACKKETPPAEGGATPAAGTTTESTETSK